MEATESVLETDNVDRVEYVFSFGALHPLSFELLSPWIKDFLFMPH